MEMGPWTPSAPGIHEAGLGGACQEVLSALEVELSAVRAFCREARIFEAHAAFTQLEASLADAQKAID